ncbi:MAG: DUF3127 domain-containing protein [Desulfurellales bacterium]|nr:MAG: DUF3127 domain-containing protein [Desulfurellales bacterium]
MALPKFKVSGRILQIGEVNTYGTKNYRKREIVVVVADDENSDYDQPVKFSIGGKGLEKFDEVGFQDDDMVEVEFMLRGNENPKRPGMFFVDLTAWNVDHLGQRHQRRDKHPQRRVEPTREDTGRPSRYSGKQETLRGPVNDEDEIPF